MKWLKQIEYYFLPMRKPDLEVEALVKEAEENKLRPKNISEPIISFVRTVENNPKRFKIKRDCINISSRYYEYVLLDCKTKECFAFRVLWSYTSEVRYRLPEYVTSDEKEYIIDSLTKVFQRKTERLSELREQRSKRKGEKERSRLKSIYCKNMEGV